jgi:hypothetical protein
MATDMEHFAKIAEEHGIDPLDKDAVDDWFVNVVPKLEEGERQKIMSTLLSKEGIPGDTVVFEKKE